MFAARALRDLGYEYVAGASGGRSDWVLRRAGDAQRGFEWKGQQDYDAVGEAAIAYVQAQLSALCGLVPLPLPPARADAHSVVYASPGLEGHRGPLLLLVCGAPPGGGAGVWGRSLCINASLREGSMFDYVFRAQECGWAVLVANPNVSEVNGVPVAGSECPHLHLQTLWEAYVGPSAAACVLVVAHSYGGPAVVNLLKSSSEACGRVRAIALTDGMAFKPGSMLHEVVPAAEPTQDGAAERLRARLRGYAELAPAAFAPASPAVCARLAEVGRNFVASQLPLGTRAAEDREGMPAISAGHESHPSTTHAATEEVFAFLQRAADCTTGAVNDEFPAPVAAAAAA